MFERPALFVVAFVVLAGIACAGPDAPASSVPDSTFIRTMVELQRVSDDSLMDSTMRDSARHVVLRRHRLSAEELVQAAKAMAGDPDRAIRVWQAIDSGRYRRGTTQPVERQSSAPIGHATTPSRPQQR